MNAWNSAAVLALVQDLPFVWLASRAPASIAHLSI